MGRRLAAGLGGPRLPLALIALGVLLVLGFVLALAWAWGGPRPQHDVAITLATTEVGA
jgi:ABC-type transporter Mla subunit MlaD